MKTLPAASIIVQDRQRQDSGTLDDNFVASVARRLIHPIVLRRDTDTESPILVAGGQRLAALIKAGITDLTEGTHFRFMEDLGPVEAQTIELEENIKRKDLPWRDHARAVGRLNELYKAQNGPSWTLDKTARELNITVRQTTTILMVYRNLGSPILKDAGSIDQSYSILQTAAERRTASIVSQINETGSQIFGQPSGELNGLSGESSSDLVAGSSNDNDSKSVLQNQATEEGDAGIVSYIPRFGGPTQTVQQNPIICTDFLEWIKTYSGPKFTLLHCDFPYDVDYAQYAKSTTSTDEDYDFKGYQSLLDALCGNIEKIASYSSHLVFWFSMKFYQETKAKLQTAGFYVHDHPLIWLKSDNAGIIPGRDNMFPRRIYETALLASRGKRPLIKSLSNGYAAPSPPNSLHPSQKSEPVLRHFFSMLVDETTDMLDPTAGSGTSLRAAEECGARSVLGLELNPSYAEMANTTTIQARNLRKAAKP